MNDENIIIKGAKVNNLKNLSIEIPRDKFIVVTGISGSGKSSLVFDTLYAEGQRRFSQSLSSYARQFLGRMTKPDVDSIEGIAPAIAISQKVSTKNPRSTVATTTEIYDFLRIVFARIGHTISPISGCEVKADSVASVMEFIDGIRNNTIYILADISWDKNEPVELMLGLKEQGYNRLYANNEVVRIDAMLQRESFPEMAYLLLDRVQIENEPIDADTRTRLLSSISLAFEIGNGDIAISSQTKFEIDCRGRKLPRNDRNGISDPIINENSVIANETKWSAAISGPIIKFSNRFELDGIKFQKPEEYLFSFNSPLGACPKCGGLGKVIGISEDLVIPDKSKSIYDEAIAPWRGEKMSWFKDKLISQSSRLGIPIFEPYCKLSSKVKKLIWESHSDPLDENSIVGINEFFQWVDSQKYKIQFKYMQSRYSGKAICQSCGGSRLRKDALYVKLGGKSIAEVLEMNINQALDFFNNLQLNSTEQSICKEALYEIRNRLQCIKDVGLSYLTLNRACNTLSGGESQRINLVSSLGSTLVGSMYILDEPSIGLHSRDTQRLISVLLRLRDEGNTVIVVEHDEDIMRSADILIDLGPKAGLNGGELVYKGRLEDGIHNYKDYAKSLTLQYLSGNRPRYSRNIRKWEYSISVMGAMQHNLKNIDVRFPLNVLTVVTGVSGSGKSSLVGDILYPALYHRINGSGASPGTFRGLSGNLDRISQVEYVDQNPIGRSSRSNAVTYLKIYDDIRTLMASQQASKINGFGPNYFSFNTDGGRCPQCQGEGIVRIEMQFMADVKMVCNECGGKRFKPDVLDVRYRDKNIDDILNMSVDEAIDFFDADPISKNIAIKLRPLQDVGLGYLKLGQSSSNLSGGESQRIKLAYFLSISAKNKNQDKIMFIFDEPTTGLHFYDVEKLLKSFDALLNNGHTVVVVEHNPDVIRSADWVIDLGPEGGDKGGEIVFEGTPEQLKDANTYTAKYI